MHRKLTRPAGRGTNDAPGWPATRRFYPTALAELGREERTAESELVQTYTPSFQRSVICKEGGYVFGGAYSLRN